MRKLEYFGWGYHLALYNVDYENETAIIYSRNTGRESVKKLLWDNKEGWFFFHNHKKIYLNLFL